MRSVARCLSRGSVARSTKVARMLVVNPIAVAVGRGGHQRGPRAEAGALWPARLVELITHKGN